MSGHGASGTVHDHIPIGGLFRIVTPTLDADEYSSVSRSFCQSCSVYSSASAGTATATDSSAAVRLAMAETPGEGRVAGPLSFNIPSGPEH